MERLGGLTLFLRRIFFFLLLSLSVRTMHFFFFTNHFRVRRTRITRPCVRIRITRRGQEASVQSEEGIVKKLKKKTKTKTYRNVRRVEE